MVTPVGAPGSPGMIVPELVVAPAPSALTPATVKLYVCPLARFGTVNDVTKPTRIVSSDTLPNHGVIA
jgi:hypothetical protein